MTHSSSSSCTSSRGGLGNERPPTAGGSPVRREGREAEREGEEEAEGEGREEGEGEGGGREWERRKEVGRKAGGEGMKR